MAGTAFAVGMVLAVAPAVLAAQMNDRGELTDNVYSEDFPDDARWEICRTCHLTVTGFIEAVNEPSKYTANEEASPNEPNDMPEFDMIKTYDEVVMPAMTRKYSAEFMVVRTNEPLNANGCLPDTPAYAQYRDVNFTDCDLLLVTKWKENHHATANRCGQDKYGRSNVVAMTTGPDNIGWEYEEMIPGNRFMGSFAEYMGSMAVGWHEFNHGMLGSLGLYKKSTRAFHNHNQGMGSTFLDSVIRTPPAHWPPASFVQHFMKNLPGLELEVNPGGQGLYYVNSPRALEMARYWTNCPNLKGYPLKNSADWGERIWGHHANFGGNWGDVNCYGRNAMVSAMTYGLYEDSGLWKVNWTGVDFNNVNFAHTQDRNATKLSLEHFKTGCGFFEKPWPLELSDDNSSSTISPVNGMRYHNPTPGWRQFLCNRAAYGGTRDATKRNFCSGDRMSKAICGRRSDVDEFDEGGWGWHEPGEGWEDELVNPYRATRVMVIPDRLPGESDVEGSTAIPGSCADAGSQNPLWGESASDASRCFHGTLRPDGDEPWAPSYETAFCFEHRCASGTNLIEFKLSTSATWHTCPELGGTVEVPGFSGHVTCPHQMLMCPANCPGDCNGRGVCNRETGICMCTETLVSASYSGAGCEVEWTTYWPEEYPYDGDFTVLEVRLEEPPHWTAAAEPEVLASVAASLGVDEDVVDLDASTVRYEVVTEHFLPGVTLADFDALVNNVNNPALRYERYEGMVTGNLRGVEGNLQGGLTYKDVVLSPPSETTLDGTAGLAVPFIVYPETRDGASVGIDVRKMCAKGSTFTNVATAFGVDVIVSKPPVFTVVTVVTVGTNDPDAIAAVSAAAADPTAFDTAVQTEAKARGMYDVASPSPAAADAQGLDTGVVVGISVGGVVFLSIAGYVWSMGSAASGAVAPLDPAKTAGV